LGGEDIEISSRPENPPKRRGGRGCGESDPDHHDRDHRRQIPGDQRKFAKTSPVGQLREFKNVPNLASRSRYDQGLKALDAAVVRKSEEMWFVLANRKLDLGEDPHLMTSMRRFMGDPPVQAEPEDPTLRL